MLDFEKIETYRENNRLEVKRAAGGLPESLWASYSAMANCYGGMILLGVVEKGNGTLEPTGLLDAEKMRQDFWNTINDRKKVNINLLTDSDVDIVELKGCTILTIRIPMAKRENKPVYINDDLFGGTYRRNGEGDYHCTKSEVRAMLRDQTEETMDMKVLPDHDLDELNRESIRLYRSRHNVWRDDHVWRDLSDAEYLERIGAARLSKEDGKIHPTGAGLLMFGEEYKILYEYPEFFLDFREMLDPTIRWTDRVQSQSGDWSGNLFDFFFRIYPKLVKDLKVPFKLEGITRVDDTPVHKAVREALVNCIVNTDFYAPRGVVIRKEADYIIMENPGYVRTGKEQMLKGGISDPRNKTLMKMFNLIGIGERAGSGVPNIYAVWATQGWDAPFVDEQYGPDRTILTLPVISSERRMIENNLKDGSRNDVIDTFEMSLKDHDDTLNDTKDDTLEEKILKLIANKPEITQNEIGNITGKSIITVKRTMKNLSDKGFITRIGGRKTGSWKILK